MSRDFFINGESMILVKGRSDSAISVATQLGLADSPIRLTPELRRKDLHVDAWGSELPADVQIFLAAVTVRINFIHFDRSILDTCIGLSMGGVTTGSVGQLTRAGTRMGGGLPRFAVGNNYIGLNITSPVGNKPWRFYYAYLADTPFEFPLGTDASVVSTTWRVVPYTQDPWGGGSGENTVAGTGAAGYILWDYLQDS